MRAVFVAATLSVTILLAHGFAQDLPVHVVRIDAVVTDARGGPAAGLAASDFELLEDGKPQTVEDARLLSGDARFFAIYLDEYRVSAGASTDRVREALTRFLDQDVTARDMVVVMKPLDSLFTIQLTHDRDEARRIVANFAGRKDDYAPRNAYERNNFIGTPARIEPLRAQVTMSALNALAMHLGGLGDGRKSLIVVGEDFVRTSRARRQEYLTTFETVIRSANRAHVSIYPVSPSATGDLTDDDHAAMRALASDTSGQTIAGTGDLAALLHRITVDAGAYYVLTYRASHREDGRFHEILVRPKKAGVQVRARSGYWAPSAEDRLREAVIARANTPPAPVPVSVPRHISPLVRTWFGFSLGDGGRTRVTFVWEPAGVAGDRVARPARLVLRAFDADGTVLLESAVRPTGPGAIDEQGGTPTRAVFDVAPGRLRLQMAIQDAAQKDLDLDSRDIAIRDFRRGVTIGTPEILRARTALELRTLEADPAAVPVSSREFSRTEQLLIRVAAYAPNGTRPSLSARLLGPTGDALRQLTVDVMADGENEVDLPLAGLPPNNYLLELTAKSPAGDAKDLLNFRVTN